MLLTTSMATEVAAFALKLPLSIHWLQLPLKNPLTSSSRVHQACATECSTPAPINESKMGWNAFALLSVKPPSLVGLSTVIPFIMRQDLSLDMAPLTSGATGLYT